MDHAPVFEHLTVRPRRPGFAAWVDGVDLRGPIGAPVQAELRQALAHFEVLFFDPQPLTPEQHLALAGVFGPIATDSLLDRQAGQPLIDTIVNDADKPPNIDVWHSDMSWHARPPAGTVVQITETPPLGGATCFASTRLAYAALSNRMQAYLDGLMAEHSWEISGLREFLLRRSPEAFATAQHKHPPVQHPVVLTHPNTGLPCLFVNSLFTRRIVDLDPRESQGVLQFLYQWMQRPEFVLQHDWQPNGLVVWDNRSTQHYAVADYWPHRRVNQRVTFDAPT
jgi:taurine dioxygenase